MIFILPALISALDEYPLPELQPREHDDEVFDISPRNQIFNSFSQHSTITGNRNQRNFFFSTVYSADCVFEKCYALGFALTFGAGGAIFTQACDFYALDSEFNSNSAIYGGSLAILNSDCHLLRCNFISNSAHKHSGAILALFTNSIPELQPQPLLFITHFNVASCRFESNSALVYHGGVTLSGLHDAYFDGCVFTGNTAPLMASALCSYDSPLVLRNTIFQHNTLSPLSSPTPANPGAGKGCAIVFQCYSSRLGTSTDTEIQLNTQDCCFSGNRALDRGGDIYFGGFCKWSSYRDIFEDVREASIMHSSLNIEREYLPGQVALNPSSYGVYSRLSETLFGVTNSRCKSTLTPITMTMYPTEDNSYIHTMPPVDIGAPYVPSPTKMSTQTTKWSHFVESGVMIRSITATKQQTATPTMSRSPTRSSYLDIPPRSRTWKQSVATMTFQFEVTATPPPSATSNGATWPLQSTTSVHARTPTRSLIIGIPPTTGITPSRSSLWEIPDPSATVSISFQFEPHSSPTVSRTAVGATWPLQTLSNSVSSPSPSLFGETLSQSIMWEVPEATPSVSISFQFEAEATRKQTLDVSIWSEVPKKTLRTREVEISSLTNTLVWVLTEGSTIVETHYLTEVVYDGFHIHSFVGQSVEVLTHYPTQSEIIMNMYTYIYDEEKLLDRNLLPIIIGTGVGIFVFIVVAGFISWRLMMKRFQRPIRNDLKPKLITDDDEFTSSGMGKSYKTDEFTLSDNGYDYEYEEE